MARFVIQPRRSRTGRQNGWNPARRPGRLAFTALASLIERIVNPSDNVVPLKAIDKAQAHA
jgi:hypothetical protein